ncbi:efflux RND transporter permease subunit [Agaribacterium sp. ZY112]|uniref:efflux RND transporter permease subunit n=1 Tax=Agaribacterium sp. ZY112 TaxID=3233574 RepID=UPI0035266BB5
MNKLMSWFIRNPVAANFLMAAIMLIGLLNLNEIRIEGFPKLPADTIEINVVDYGASAAEIEQSINRDLEQAFEGLAGVDFITSIAIDGQAILQLKKQDSYPVEKLLEGARLRIDSLSNLPSSAEKPQLQLLEFNYPALIVQIYGDVNQQALQKAAQKLKQRLYSLDQVSQINQWGQKDYEVSIDVSPAKLQSLGLSFNDVALAISQGSQRYRSGEIKTQHSRIQLRADKQAKYKLDFAKIPVQIPASGRIIRLEDIAEINDGFNDQDVRVLFQGKSTVGFEIAISQKGNIIDLNEDVQNLIRSSQDILSEDIQAEVWANQSTFVTERLNMLSSNAWQGLILVFIILSLFLQSRLAFWVALGIPISVLGVFSMIGSPLMDYSLNDVTTLGLIIVLGIIVDDAVVVGESVHEARQQIEDPIAAAEHGVHQVATATIFGVLTSIAAFFPLTQLDSALGKVLGSFSIVVILALTFSLIESKFILPSHLAHSNGKNNNENILSRYLGQVRKYLNDKLNYFTNHYYEPSLRWCLNNRIKTLSLFFCSFILVIAMLDKGHIRSVFFPSIPGNIISIKMSSDSQSPFSMNLSNADKITHAAKELNQKLILEHALDQAPINKVMVASVGNETELYAQLSSEAKKIGSLAIMHAWQKNLAPLEGVYKLSFSASEETAGGFQLEVYSENINDLNAAAEAVQHILKQLPEVSSVSSDLQALKPELKLRLNERGEALNLRLEDIARHIGDGYGGLELQRYSRGHERVKTYLRFDQQHRDNIHDLEKINIALSNGKFVPLRSVVEFEANYVPQYFWRKNLRYGAQVQAQIDKDKTNAKQVYQNIIDSSLWQELKRQDPSLELIGAGELAKEDEISNGLKHALLIALLLIYGLLAIPLKSYLQPFIIMSVIPFGFVGALLGHYVMDLPLSVLSFFGMLALSGIVVNDSLVLVNRCNQLREQGNKDALVQACKSRVRAIFLTTVTTVAGLLPILSEQSEQAQYLIPAATSLAFGEIFATLITLILIPLLLSFRTWPPQKNEETRL